MTGLALLAGAAALLAAGADLFSANAAGLARRLQVSTLAVGLLFAGAEPEELATALVAAARHRPGVAVGDAVGANVTMLLLVVGFAGVTASLDRDPALVRRTLWALGASTLLAVALLDGRLGRPEAVVLVAVFVAFAVAVVRRTDHDPAEPPRAADLRAGLVALAGLALVTVGGRLAVDGAVRVAAAWHRSDRAIGLSLVAFATSSELLALLWASRRRGVPQLALAGVVGSVVANASLTLGVTALWRPLDTTGASAAAWLVVALCTVLLVHTPTARSQRTVGAAMLAGYVAYLVAVLR